MKKIFLGLLMIQMVSTQSQGAPLLNCKTEKTKIAVQIKVESLDHSYKVQFEAPGKNFAPHTANGTVDENTASLELFRDAALNEAELKEGKFETKAEGNFVLSKNANTGSMEGTLFFRGQPINVSCPASNSAIR